jgi:hypothetical protein
VDQQARQEKADDNVVRKIKSLTGLSLLDTQTLLKKGITEASNAPNLSDRKIKSILKLYQKSWFVRTW